MTIQYFPTTQGQNFSGIGSVFMVGLSTDTKPTSTVPNASLFIETDTGRIYTLVTGVWVEKTCNPSYPTGQGSTVTQLTSKATGVTINTTTGQITMNNAALAAAAEVSFIVTNSACGANDIVVVNHKSAGTFGAYAVVGGFPAAGSFRIMVSNMSAGSLTEAIVLQYCIIKGVIA